MTFCRKTAHFCPLQVLLDGVIIIFTDMREASKRLAESLFDSYENDWAGEEDLGAIVEVCVILLHKSNRIISSPGDTNLYLSPTLTRN